MSLITTLIGGKIVVGAFAVGSIALGGTAAAAATGTLPTALQEQAHVSFGAPAPQGDDGAVPTSTESPDPTESADPTESPDPVESPDPSESADPTESPAPQEASTPDPAQTPTTVTVTTVPANAHGLCTAWNHHGLVVGSTGYAHLLAEAGGAGTDLGAWCAPHLSGPGHLEHEGTVGTDGSSTQQDGTLQDGSGQDGTDAAHGATSGWSHGPGSHHGSGHGSSHGGSHSRG